MRLPQDRILHIDTEFKDGKVNVVAEWQGELVRCKDCRLAEDDITHMYCVYFGHKVYGEDYCSNAVERKGGAE